MSEGYICMCTIYFTIIMIAGLHDAVGVMSFFKVSKLLKHFRYFSVQRTFIFIFVA